MAMKKDDLVAELMLHQGMRRQQAIIFVEHFFEHISLRLERGESVKLSGFGKFDLRDKDSRPGRNPKTGELVPVSARRVVTFKPGRNLKGLIVGDKPFSQLSESQEIEDHS